MGTVRYTETIPVGTVHHTERYDLHLWAQRQEDGTIDRLVNISSPLKSKCVYWVVKSGQFWYRPLFVMSHVISRVGRGVLRGVLRSLRHNLRAKVQGHHAFDRLEERGVERRSERAGSVINLTHTATVSKVIALVKVLRDGAERMRAFPTA